LNFKKCQTSSEFQTPTIHAIDGQGVGAVALTALGDLGILKQLVGTKAGLERYSYHTYK